MIINFQRVKGIAYKSFVGHVRVEKIVGSFITKTKSRIVKINTFTAPLKHGEHNPSRTSKEISFICSTQNILKVNLMMENEFAISY